MPIHVARASDGIAARYTSVFDDVILCTSGCRYDPRLRRVFAITSALNADAADTADACTDEYVTLADGTVLRAHHGVTFAY